MRASPQTADIEANLRRLRAGTRKPQYTLDQLRTLWSPFVSSFRPRFRPPRPTAEDLAAVLPWAEHPRWRIRQRALLALGAAGCHADRIRPVLLAALTDPHPLVRVSAADVLRRLPPRPSTALAAALHDETWRVRWHAAEALLRADRPDGIAAILQRAAPRRLALEWLDAVQRLPALTPGLVAALEGYRDATGDPWVQTFRQDIQALLDTRTAP